MSGNRLGSTDIYSEGFVVRGQATDRKIVMDGRVPKAVRSEKMGEAEKERG